ncbi:hypothetical protein [Azospirillum argentinense]
MIIIEMLYLSKIDVCIENRWFRDNLLNIFLYAVFLQRRVSLPVR